MHVYQAKTFSLHTDGADSFRATKNKILYTLDNRYIGFCLVYMYYSCEALTLMHSCLEVFIVRKITQQRSIYSVVHVIVNPQLYVCFKFDCTEYVVSVTKAD